MRLTLSDAAPARSRAQLLVLATTAETLRSEVERLDKASQLPLGRWIARMRFKAEAGKSLLFQTHRAKGPAALLLRGIDPRVTPSSWYELADQAIQQARELKAQTVAVRLSGGLATAEAIAKTAEGLLLAAYRFDHFKSAPRRQAEPARVELQVDRVEARARESLRRGRLFGAATCYARDLIVRPAGEVTPAYLGNEARRLATRHGLRLRVLDQRALARLGMGAILGVGQGSAQPPRLIELIYRPRVRAKASVAIVGKGITFDSGGLSLKNPDSMQGQKRDMAGGAVVLGVMSVITALGPPVELRAYVAAAENMPDGRALKPGDVLRAFNGKTIEVLNTDAEGRLVLADALAYAARAKPDVIIDLATLTAAVGTALGRRYAGIMGTDPGLCRALIAAGQQAGENLWELPLVEEYRQDIKSRVADLKNTGEGSAGTIIGGLFLSEFVGKMPWAHIDFSSTVVTDRAFAAHPVGPTGFGVRTILEYVTGL
jgi:leucyl aminopeptidase